MKRSVIPLLFLLFAYSVLLGQDFSIEGFLASAYDDPAVRNVYDQSNYLRSANMRAPNINEVEFRARSGGLSIPDDDLRLRLTFTNFGEIKEGVRYKNLLEDNYELEYNVQLHAALVNRYKLVLEHLNITSSLKLNELQILNLDDQIKVEKANIINGSGNIEDLVDLERDHTDLLKKGSELRNKQITLEGQILGYYRFNGAVNLHMDSLITPLEIQGLIDAQSDLTNPEIALKEQDLLLDQQETALEFKENKGDLGFFQAEYETNNGSINQNLGYQLGFTIPIINPDRIQIEEMKLRNLKRQQDLEMMLAKYQQQMEIVEREIKEQISQYEFLESQLNTLTQRNQSLHGQYLNVNALLSMQENELKMEEALSDQQVEIMETYLSWLDLSGMISNSPRKNYLYGTFPEIRE